MALIALVDADIVAFRCAATAENDEEWIAIARTKELIETILQEVGATEYKCYLTGQNNFRKQIYPEYKANRIGKPLPKHLDACKQFLVDHWGATVCEGYEADDALGINQEKFLEGNTIICSIDKDLRQIPGEHYNFVKKERDYVNDENALRTFYTQLLVGDPGDNIRGCPGIGKAKAPKILDGCTTDDEMFEAVRSAYNDDTSMLINGQLLWIWRQMNDIWCPTKLQELVLEVPSESTQLTEAETTPSTALGTTT